MDALMKPEDGKQRFLPEKARRLRKPKISQNNPHQREFESRSK
jgi:hypothetical protein